MTLKASQPDRERASCVAQRTTLRKMQQTNGSGHMCSVVYTRPRALAATVTVRLTGGR